jgi:hypothetical protein
VNKQSELFYLNKFKESFSNFPQGNISPDERPDFLVKAPNEIVGIEITGFYRETSSSTQPPLQQRESVRHKIITLAKSIYDNKGLPSVYVNVHFDLNFHCRKSEVQPIAETLAELAEQSLSSPTDEKMWRIGDIQLKGIHLLFVKKMKLAKSYWSAPLASFVPTVNPQQIQDIFDEKNALCGDYRKKCDKIWLVIVMDRFEASSFSEIPETTLEHLYAHRFDSAFLFFYNYTHSQKPPFLLQRA